MANAVTLVAGMQTDGQFGDLPPFQISGVVQGTAGSIMLYDGSAAGPLVMASAAVGTVTVNDPIYVRVGLFVVLTGGATGSVLTA